MLERNPENALRVIDGLNQELQRAQALIQDLGLKSAPERLASFSAVAQAAFRPA